MAPASRQRDTRAWRDMLATMQEALTTAEESGITLAFEPEINNVVASAAKGGVFWTRCALPASR